MMFERDIFISYAHIDNMPLREGQKGWISNFHRALNVRLAQLMGERPQIWRDQKLQGNDSFGDEIVDQFPKTATMISILSPRYIKSDWCTKEVKEFYKTATTGIGAKIGNKSRIFKVIKTEIPYDAYPSEIADSLGYEFFVREPDNGRSKELNQRSVGELENIYWAKLDDVAHDICDLLAVLKQKNKTSVFYPQVPQEQDQTMIYLAETSSDLKKQRDMIKRELLQSGYGILPDTRLPAVESKYKHSVENLLNQSVLSIHLVGGSYGPVPEGSQKSIVPLQNELAAKKSKTSQLQRLIWLLPDSDENLEDKRQENFIHQLRTNAQTQYGADFFETSIEDFKFAIHDKLKRLKSSPAHIPTGTAAARTTPITMTVYLAETNYELKDERESIKQRLMAQGYQVIPTQPLPLVYPELKETIDQLLEQSHLAIHLLGEDYGIVPDKTEKSIISVQNEQAAEKSKQGKLQRLVWISPKINQTDERQLSFIRSVKANAGLVPNDDIFEIPDEEMESTIFKKIKIIEEKKRKKREDEKTSAGTQPIKGPPQIYLICDQRDLDGITELEDFLYNSEFDVILPSFEGEEEELMRDHRENLKSCDAVLIYYGAGNDLWMRSITRELTKIAGYGRTSPLHVKAALLAPPKTRSKEHFRSHGIFVINGMPGFSTQSVEPFAEMVKTIGRV
jgi:hypothetical protein